MNRKDRGKFTVFFVLVFFVVLLHTSMNCSYTASVPIDSKHFHSATLYQKPLYNSVDYMSSEAVWNSFMQNNIAARVMRENKEEGKRNCLLNLFTIAFAIVLFPILIYGTACYLIKGCLITLRRITVFLHKSDGKKKGSFTFVIVRILPNDVFVPVLLTIIGYSTKFIASTLWAVWENHKEK